MNSIRFVRFVRVVVATSVFALATAAISAIAAPHTPYKVMIVTWSGCEQACQGFEDYLRERGVAAEILLRDAGGQQERLLAIRQEAAATRPDLVVTYGTNVSRALAGTLDDAESRDRLPMPKVFMIVADPVGAGLVKSLDAPGRSDLTGTYNRVPESVNIETIRAYQPRFRRLGMLVNRDEKNALVKRDEMVALGKSIGFDVVSADLALDPQGKPRVEDIAARLGELKAAGVDFVYLGSSSFLREQRDAFTSAALAQGLPLLTPYEVMVRESKALVSVAARYYDVGRLAAEQARKVLQDGADPGRLPIARMTRFAITINMGVARQLRKIPPIELLQVAEIVN